jgi:hypothetical protein
MIKMSVSDPAYATAVNAMFGCSCCYCERELENDRAAVEHLDGMNRFRAGLHSPGNVIVACKRCNNEKRRDDQLHELVIGVSGWESFLAHNGTRCQPNCKTCAYWQQVWPDSTERSRKLGQAHARISKFRSEYPDSVLLSQRAKPFLQQESEKIYRECQTFATSCIRGSVDRVAEELLT